MRFETPAVPLAEPLGPAGFIEGIVKPEGAVCGVESFAAEASSGQLDIHFSSSLVEISVERRLKTPGSLKDHLGDRSDVYKVQAIGPDPVDADVSHHQHSQFSFALCFRSHQSRQKFDFRLVVGYYGQDNPSY
jgi:hypothetical protein